MTELSILMIDDSTDDAALILHQLRNSNYHITMKHIDHLDELQSQLQEAIWDVILCDIMMPNLTVQQVLTTLKEHEIETPVLVMSGHIEMAQAIDLLHAGAKDFIRKDDTARLIPSIERALNNYQVRQEKKYALEALQVAKEEAEKANQEKSYFLMVMNHELRRPLHGIEGLLDILSEENQAWTQEQRDFLEMARSSTTSINQLVNDVLDFNAAESGCMHIQNHTFDLVTFLVDTLDPFFTIMKSNGLHILFEMKNLPHAVISDSSRLRQILFNLVNNAIKFTHSGKITLYAEMQLDAFEREVLYFSITDTGEGLSEENLQHIFQPFANFHQADTEQHLGAGLGTSIVKKILEMMEGQIWVKSSLGVGSCFSFEIPIIVCPKTSENPYAHVDYVYHDNDSHDTLDQLSRDFTKAQNNTTNLSLQLNSELNILLVEDDPVSQIITQRGLKQANMQIHLASNGLDAWDKIQQQSYDVLITDLEMPKLDGISLTKKIRTTELSNQHKALPIICLTAHKLPEIKKACLDAGMNQFLTKPIDINTVIHTIRNLIKPSNKKDLA
ncbi:MAG: response regulator [Mariprofundaceae bacterium]|nr:response regulator [Mariprofundaceae bacterium]